MCILKKVHFIHVLHYVSSVMRVICMWKSFIWQVPQPYVDARGQLVQPPPQEMYGPPSQQTPFTGPAPPQGGDQAMFLQQVSTPPPTPGDVQSPPPIHRPSPTPEGRSGCVPTAGVWPLSLIPYWPTHIGIFLCFCPSLYISTMTVKIQAIILQ